MVKTPTAMVDKEQLKRNLSRIGLNAYQSDVYLTLMEEGSTSAVEIAKRSDVPSSRIYDVLNNLEHEGYVETFQREGKRHARAKEPSEIVDTLRDVSEDLVETAEEVEEAWQPDVGMDHHIDLMNGVDPAIEHAKAFIREAEVSVDVAATRAQYYQLREALSTAIDNGIVVRVSVEDIDREEIQTEQPATKLRKRRIPGPFLVVTDRTHTCFAPNERAPEDYGIVINDRLLSYIFRWHFQISLWAPCKPIYVRTSDDHYYVNMEAFIRDIFPVWRAGILIPVTVAGTELSTGVYREVTGIVSDIVSPNINFDSDRRPGYGDLGGFATLIVIDPDGKRYSVGSWGAAFEDIEARKIILHSDAMAPELTIDGSNLDPEDV